MPSTYSQNLRVELIANGEQSGTWGNTTNVNLGTILDSAIAGYTAVTVGSATDLALTANNGAADQSRNMIVQLNSATGGDFNLFIPPASKFYVIRNNTTSTATINNSTALNGTTASGGTTVAIKTGITSLIFSDGTNVREALTGFAGNLVIEGDLTVNGDTTLGNSRISGAYSAPTGSTLSVNTTPTAHGYATGDYVWLIVKDGDAKSGYYGPITISSTTAFTFSYASATGLSGDCAVTNDSTTLNAVIRLNGGNDGVIIEGASTLPALRITQTSTGAALLIDDEANPDSTPFLVDTAGRVVTGNTATLTTFNNTTTTPRIQEIGIIANDAALGMALFSTTDSASPTVDLAKAGAAAVGTYTAVVDNEALGLIRFSGSDGTDFAPAASIGAFADAEFTTSGDTTDSPGRLVFSTVPDGSNTLTERMRIDNAGNVIIGIGEKTTSATGGLLRAPNETGGSNLVGANFTIAAGNGTGTAGGSGSILFQTAPVNSSGAATDANTLATVMAIANTGNVGIGSTSLASFSLRISKNVANAAGGTAYGIYQDGDIQSNITTAVYNNTSANTEAAVFTLGNLSHYRAAQSTFGAGSTVTAQYGFTVDSTLIGATDNYGFYAENTAAVTAGKTSYGFYSTVNAATGGGTTWGYYSNGTANNYFSNNLLIGGANPAPLVNGQTAASNRLSAAADGDEASIVVRGSSTSAATGYGILALQKTLAAASATLTATTSGSVLGAISFDGVNLNLTPAIAQGAAILSVQDAVATTSYVPAGLRFETTNTTSGSLEAMRITSNQNVVIGRDDATASPVGGLLRAPDKTGSNVVGVDLTIAAGNGTGTGGSGSILFQTAPAGGTSTLETVVSIANTGNVVIGASPSTANSLLISKDITRPTTGSAYGVQQNGSVQSVVDSAGYYLTVANVASRVTALPTLHHYYATEGTYTGAVTTQYGFRSGTDLIGATTNYGFAQTGVTASTITTGKTVYSFYSDQDASSVSPNPGLAYGFYASGTAVNYFSNLLIGGTTARSGRNSTGAGNITPSQQIIGTDESTSALGVFNYSTTTTLDPSISFNKSLNATVGSFSQTTNGTELGGISFNGVGLSTDTSFATAAYIRARVTTATTLPLATGSVPGQLAFGTTNTGTAPVDRMTLDNRGMLSVGIAAASGGALTTTSPAKLYVDDTTYTDNVSTSASPVSHGTLVSLDNGVIGASNADVVYTNASTLYIAGAPTNGSNVTIDYPYALFIDSGNMRLDGNLTQVGSTATATVVPLTIEGLTTATPADGITTALNFRTQTGATSNDTKIGAAIRAIATDVSTGTEDFDLSFVTMAGGNTTLGERLRAKSTGEFQFDSGYGSVATAYGTRAWVNFNPTVYTTVTATYTWASTTCTVSENSHGFLAGDIVYLNFTSGTANNDNYKLFYTVVSVTTNTFTVSGASLTQASAANVSYYLCTPNADGNVRRISVGYNGYTMTTYNPCEYAIMFDTAMPDDNYAWTGSSGRFSDTSAGSGGYPGTWLSSPQNRSSNTLLPLARWKRTTALWVTSYNTSAEPTWNYPVQDVCVVVTR